MDDGRSQNIGLRPLFPLLGMVSPELGAANDSERLDVIVSILISTNFTNTLQHALKS